MNKAGKLPSDDISGLTGRAFKVTNSPCIRRVSSPVRLVLLHQARSGPGGGVAEWLKAAVC